MGAPKFHSTQNKWGSFLVVALPSHFLRWLGIITIPPTGMVQVIKATTIPPLCNSLHGNWQADANGKWFWLPCTGGEKMFLDQEYQTFQWEGRVWLWWPAEEKWAWALEGPPEWNVPTTNLAGQDDQCFGGWSTAQDRSWLTTKKGGYL